MLLIVISVISRLSLAITPLALYISVDRRTNYDHYLVDWFGQGNAMN